MSRLSPIGIDYSEYLLRQSDVALQNIVRKDLTTRQNARRSSRVTSTTDVISEYHFSNNRPVGIPIAPLSHTSRLIRTWQVCVWPTALSPVLVALTLLVVALASGTFLLNTLYKIIVTGHGQHVRLIRFQTPIDSPSTRRATPQARHEFVDSRCEIANCTRSSVVVRWLIKAATPISVL